jgi:hypothetical protein
MMLLTAAEAVAVAAMMMSMMTLIQKLQRRAPVVRGHPGMLHLHAGHHGNTGMHLYHVLVVYSSCTTLLHCCDLYKDALLHLPTA